MKVRCIDCTCASDHLTEGQVYNVRSKLETPAGLMYILDYDDNGPRDKGYIFFADRFEVLK